jgi:chromosome partitioning protein
MAGSPAVKYRRNAPASKSYVELAKELNRRLKVK